MTFVLSLFIKAIRLVALPIANGMRLQEAGLRVAGAASIGIAFLEFPRPRRQRDRGHLRVAGVMAG